MRILAAWPDPELPTEKPCSKCGVVKPLADFYKQKGGKGGYRPDCKSCVKARVSQDRNTNLEYHRERDRTRYATNPNRQAQSKATARKHFLANHEKHLAQKRAYYAADPDRWSEYRARRKARLKAVLHEPYTRKEIYKRDKGRCQICGKELPPNKFSIDHIIPISKGGPDTPSNVQLTCQPCNRTKWTN